MEKMVPRQLTAILLLFLACTMAQATAVTARLDRDHAVVGETVTLILKTSDTEQSLDTDLSVLQKDFDVLNQRSETQMSFVNGRQTASAQLVVTLEPKHAGNLVIPALQFPGASSTPLRLKVSVAPVLAPGESEPVFIEVMLEPETGPYYVHSQLGLVVRIFYQTNLTEAAINPPALTQASVRLLDEVPYQADRNGNRYRVLERRYAIFPERSGNLIIPSMQLSGRLIERLSDRLWQPTVRGRRVTVESEPIHLEINPRPPEFKGEFWLPARRITLSQKISDKDQLHVGEPVTRTVIIDVVGLEENMLEEPRWPEIPNTRIYPDQPQGISRDDGDWVLGHKEFRYAIAPEEAGELVLPEIHLDWWDTVAHQQRTAILPEHRITVLPSELSLAPNVVVPPAGPVTRVAEQITNGVLGVTGKALWWQISTAVFAILWLLSLFLLFRRGPVKSIQPKTSESVMADEKGLLKQLRQACKAGDAPTARRAVSQWVRRYAPHGMRGSSRDFALLCENQTLRQAMTELDVSGFSDAPALGWEGEELWAAFKRWQACATSVKKTAVSKQPDLYVKS